MLQAAGRPGMVMRLPLKMLLVVGMTIAIMVPLWLIRATISERQGYRTQAIENVARSYAGPQALSGPVLVVPYVETIEVEEKDDKGNVVRTVRRDGANGVWTYFPNRLEVRGKLLPSTRRLGLHEVRVYELQSVSEATFGASIPADENPLLPRRIGQPWLSYGIADVRGLTGTPLLRIDGAAVELEGGFGSRAGGGVHSRLTAPAAGTTLRLNASLDISLGGTESLAWVPLAGSNVFELESSWPHPRFGGNFLPGERQVSDKGFTARWNVSSFATNAQAQFLAAHTVPSVDDPMSHLLDRGDATLTPTSAGIDAVAITLVDPVNIYSKADRATKYGLLFVLLTFVGFFVLEFNKHLPIHPIQYGLVGLALAIFFLLLVSLSEHIAFDCAYLVASAACIGLLGCYLSAVLRSRARGALFAALLAVLYSALYGLLASEDNALVLGTGLLFVSLATLMLATRRVDWYQVAVGSTSQAEIG
jgi:inner membrane protein